MKKSGFTLAELLIALGILGVIATFTIPKVLNASQDQRYKAMGKEVAAMMSAAYAQYQLDQTPSANMRIADLTQYLNYVKVDTSTMIDGVQSGGTSDCSDTASRTCLLLHNGGMLWYITGETFDGTDLLNGLRFGIDPDAKLSEYKRQEFWLLYNGRIMTWSDVPPGTNSSDITAPVPRPQYDTPWFSWN